MASEGKQVELGFVEIVESWRLLSHFFPSKVGGKPAWLALTDLPSPEKLSCGDCQKPCVFLLQVYAPVENKDACFHRTIFLFVCRNPQCSNRRVLALRSQLPLNNDFYPASPANEDTFDPKSDYPSAERYQPLCQVCGLAGPKQCGKCHTAQYCSREHQVAHWKAGHKKECSTESAAGNKGT